MTEQNTESTLPEKVDAPQQDSRNVYQRILAVQDEIRYIQRDSQTEASGKYMYVSHDAVVSKLRDSMRKHGLVYTQSIVQDSFKMGTSADKNGKPVFWIEALFDCRLIRADSPSEVVSVLVPAIGLDQQDKGPGKAISYAKKYALLTLFMLETGLDAEQDSIEREPLSMGVRKALSAFQLLYPDEPVEDIESSVLRELGAIDLVDLGGRDSDEVLAALRGFYRTCENDIKAKAAKTLDDLVELKIPFEDMPQKSQTAGAPIDVKAIETMKEAEAEPESKKKTKVKSSKSQVGDFCGVHNISPESFDALCSDLEIVIDEKTTDIDYKNLLLELVRVHGPGISAPENATRGSIS